MQHPGWISLLVLGACAADPAPPMPVSGGDVVGTWRYVPQDPTRTPVDEREVFELGADGSYAIRDRRGTDRGTYEIAGHELTIRSDAGGWVTTGFAATDDRLIVDALFPQHAGDGLAGTWIGDQRSNVASTVIELELRADGTAHVEQSGELAGVEDATWRHEPPYVVITFTEPTRTRALPVIPGLALGEWLYERID